MVSGGLYVSIEVGGGGVLVGRRPRGGWVRFSIREWGMLSVVLLGSCVVGDGIHALHWNMLRWLELDVPECCVVYVSGGLGRLFMTVVCWVFAGGCCIDYGWWVVEWVGCVLSTGFFICVG